MQGKHKLIDVDTTTNFVEPAITVSQFVDAAGKKNIDVVERGIKSKIDINSYDKVYTALHKACTVRDNEVVVEALLNAKANVNLTTKDPTQWTALLFACACNAGLSVVKKLVEKDAGVVATDSVGRTVLHFIAEMNTDWSGENEKKRIEIADYLLQRGAQPCLLIKRQYFGVSSTPFQIAEKNRLKELSSFYRVFEPKNELKESETLGAQKQLAKLEMELAETRKQVAALLLVEVNLQKQLSDERDKFHLLEEQLTESREQASRLSQENEKYLNELKAGSPVKNAMQSINNSRFNAIKEAELFYTEDDLLGEGFGGRVYRVRYNGADIAAKFIRAGNGQDEKQAENGFRHEFEIMQHIPPHPNVAGFLGGSVSTQPAQPHVLGIALMRGSLEKLLLVNKESSFNFTQSKTDVDVAKKTLRGLKDVLWYLVGASAGLVQLHAHRVVHCDVAARNFLVDFNSNCCVCDFGMSQIIPDGQSSVQTSLDTAIPLAWCAPETIIKREWSDKTDVYMFGVMIVELMTRDAPYPGFTGEKLLGIVPDILNPRKPHRPHIAGWWPSDLADLAIECMAHHPHERPVMSVVNKRLYRSHSRVHEAQQLPDAHKPTTEVMVESNYKIPPTSAYFLNYRFDKK